MNRLVVVGARAMGREACSYAKDAGFVVKGFLDDKSDALNGFVGYPPILGSAEEYEVVPEDVFVVALGDPICRRYYVDLIAGRGGRFVSVVHPAAYIGTNVKMGVGCIICPHATITNDTVIGNHVIVNVNVSINHDNLIGNFVTICPGCCLAGRVSLGERIFLGAGAIIIPDVTLGSGVYVAAGATVIDSFESGKLMGVPAKAK